MPAPESPKRRELRKALRALTNYVAGKTDNIDILPMDLDESSDFNPTFFTTFFSQPIDCARRMLDYFAHYTDACILFDKDEGLGRLWSNIGPSISRISVITSSPVVTIHASQVKEGPYPHVKALIYNNLNGADGTILGGEVMMALRLIIAQMRRARFIDQMTAPVPFPFMGPQHVRLVEAYFNGSSPVVRPSRLFDLHKKNEAAIREFGRWYFGEPVGNTKKCP
ncbi:hypothetical protein BDV27DRAFT_143596 [Aspergillus caelatus]|uniref:Uncharacterized protein n=1 Tax=Aspergillus caelatus TaxID=61420 RepID=A0A5N7A9J3_9EURO|nr:uncharacterized protein BDV27DRAFT_143596 [Aspergillus caelatus]KAE8366514.1 hypothetical protein BDV27DRAFT_143596 [Aspergillus caelatus]